VIVNTLQLAAVVTVIATGLGVVLAWLMARTRVPGKRALELLLPLPVFVSPFAAGVAWMILGSEASGLVNIAFRAVFDTEAPLVNVVSFPGLVFTMVLFLTPYAYLLTLGTLRNMNPALEEASRVHGSTYLATMFRVTLPLALPAITSALLVVFVVAAEMFSIPSMLGVPADYYTLPYLIYQSTHHSPPRWSLAAAAGIVLLLVMVLGVALQRWSTRRSERFVTIGGKGAGSSVVDIGRWRYAGAAVCWGYVLLSSVAPIAALVVGASMRYLTSSFSPRLLTLDNWTRILASSSFLEALRNTVLVSMIGPLVAILLGFLLSYLWIRMRAPLRGAAETVSMLPLSVPGIVMGLGLVWAYVSTPVYGTLAILVIAYVGRYLPHAIRTFQSTLVQIDPSLDEASRVSGAPLGRTLWNVTLPLLRIPALSAWLLLFVLMVRELNVAVMVYTSDTVVLPVLMWGEIEGGQYGAAAVLAMVEVLIIFATFLVARRILRVDLVNAMSAGR
ncbi:MAG: ABC transporter permease, partial [Pseudonocardia sp.]